MAIIQYCYREHCEHWVLLIFTWVEINILEMSYFDDLGQALLKKIV